MVCVESAIIDLDPTTIKALPWREAATEWVSELLIGFDLLPTVGGGGSAENHQKNAPVPEMPKTHTGHVSEPLLPIFF